jgi:hypothetical protein
MLDVLLFGTIASPIRTFPAIELLKKQKDLHPYKLAESVQHASTQLGLCSATAAASAADLLSGIAGQ